MNSLAILILTKNEEENIVSVVKNAKCCADEVVIIDSGSTDNTVELAEAHGARVCYRTWDNDFSAQRNFGLTQTDADWVLYLDADERLNNELIEAVMSVLSTGELNTQYAIIRKSVAFGITFNHGVLQPDRVLRMFPRTSVKWVYKVHEHPECSLAEKRLSGYIEHYTYRDWREWEEKLCLYTAIWANDALKRGKRTSLPGILIHSIGGFFKMFILRKGFLDGWLGSYLCCAYFTYTMLKYLKLYELQRKN